MKECNKYDSSSFLFCSIQMKKCHKEKVTFSEKFLCIMKGILIRILIAIWNVSKRKLLKHTIQIVRTMFVFDKNDAVNVRIFSRLLKV